MKIGKISDIGTGYSTLYSAGGMNKMASGAYLINTAVNKVNDLTAANHERVNIIIKEVERFKAA